MEKGDMMPRPENLGVEDVNMQLLLPEGKEIGLDSDRIQKLMKALGEAHKANPGVGIADYVRRIMTEAKSGNFEQLREELPRMFELAESYLEG